MFRMLIMGLSLMVTIVFLGPAYARETIILKDTFSDNKNRWPTGKTRIKESYVRNGKYFSKHKGNRGFHVNWIDLEFDQNGNFIIESTIEKKGGNNNFGYGLIWGKYKDVYIFEIRGNGYFKFYRGRNLRFTPIIDWTESGYINKGNHKNKITIKKEKDKLMFFINDQFVAETQYEHFNGNNIGFKLQGDTYVAIDDFLVKEYKDAPSSSLASSTLPTPAPIPESGINNINFTAANENNDAIAVVIGNKNYSKAKPVEYAINDARLLKRYVISALGYKEGNIFYLEDASQTDFKLFFGDNLSHKGKLFNAVKEGKSDVFVYYSGHGAPGLKDKKGYFVPVEADPQYLEFTGYPADVFYQNLSKIPARSITIVLDACFSGATIFENISPMVLEIDNPIINLNNGVVLSSSSGSQVSTWYNEKEHGMFTYFFLKAIHSRNADFDKNNKLTFNEIYKYISDKSEGVPYYARRIHGVEQNPTINGKYQGKVFVSYQ
jgi:hypothetical protein